MNDYNQTHSDAIAVMEALRAEHKAVGHSEPKPNQRAAIEGMERFLISREPFLGLSAGQQAYLDNFMELIERI